MSRDKRAQQRSSNKMCKQLQLHRVASKMCKQLHQAASEAGEWQQQAAARMCEQLQQAASAMYKWHHQTASTMCEGRYQTEIGSSNTNIKCRMDATLNNISRKRIQRKAKLAIKTSKKQPGQQRQGQEEIMTGSSKNKAIAASSSNDKKQIRQATNLAVSKNEDEKMRQATNPTNSGSKRKPRQRQGSQVNPTTSSGKEKVNKASSRSKERQIQRAANSDTDKGEKVKTRYTGSMPDRKLSDQRKQEGNIVQKTEASEFNSWQRQEKCKDSERQE